MEEFIACHWGDYGNFLCPSDKQFTRFLLREVLFKQVITPFTQYQSFYFIEKSKCDFALFFCKFPCYSASISIATVSLSHFESK